MKRKAELYAWLAALIDGEGSIMLTRRAYARGSRLYSSPNPHFRAVVSIYNTDQRLMKALVEKTGIDRVYKHTRQPKENQKKTSYSWRLVATEIREWLPLVMPWLVCKAEQATLLLEALDITSKLTPIKGQPYLNSSQQMPLILRRDEIAKQISMLNRKGRESLVERRPGL